MSTWSSQPALPRPCSVPPKRRIQADAAPPFAFGLQVTGQIAVVVNQIPACPIIFPSDPQRKERHEDSLLAWAWKSYVDDPNHAPEWLPRLPMAKVGQSDLILTRAPPCATPCLTSPSLLSLSVCLVVGLSVHESRPRLHQTERYNPDPNRTVALY